MIDAKYCFICWFSNQCVVMKHMDYHLFPSIFNSQGIIVQMCVSKVIKSELPSQWTHELARGLIYKRFVLLVHKVESPLIDALWCWTLEWEGLCFSGGPVVCFPYNSDLSSSCCSRQSRALHMHDTDDLSRTAMSYIPGVAFVWFQVAVTHVWEGFWSMECRLWSVCLMQ